MGIYAPETVGLGCIVSCLDAYSGTATRIGHSAQSLQAAVGGAAEDMMRSAKLMTGGAIQFAAGTALLGSVAFLATGAMRGEKELSRLRSIEFQAITELDQAARKFSNTWAGVTSEQFVAAAYDMRRAVRDLSDSAIIDLTRVAEIGGRAAEMAPGAMSSSLAGLLSMYRGVIKDVRQENLAQQLIGGIVQAKSTYKASGEEIIASLTDVTTQASRMGMTIPEQLVFLGNLIPEMGGGAGAAMSRILMLLSNMAKKLGIVVTDSRGRLIPLVDILAKLQRHSGQLERLSEFTELKMALGPRGIRPLFALISKDTSELRNEIDKMAGAMNNGADVANRMASQLQTNLSGRLTILGQQFSNLRETIGGTFAPSISPLLGMLQRGALALQRWVDLHPALTKAVVGAVMVFGTLLVILGAIKLTIVAVAGAWGMVTAAVTGIIAAVSACIGWLSSLSAFFALTGSTSVLLTNPLGWVVLAIMAIIAAVGLLVVAWKYIAPPIIAVGKAVGTVFSGIFQTLRFLSGDTTKLSATTYAALQRMGIWWFVKGLAMLIYRVKEALVSFWEGFSGAFGIVGKAFAPIMTCMTGLWQAFAWIGKAIGGVLYSGLIWPLLQVWKISTWLWLKLASSSTSFWKTLGYWIGKIIGLGLVAVILTLLTPFILLAGAIVLVTKALQWFWGLCKSVGSAIGSLFQVSTWLKLANVIKNVLGTAINWLLEAVQAVIDKINAVKTWVTGAPLFAAGQKNLGSAIAMETIERNAPLIREASEYLPSEYTPERITEILATSGNEAERNALVTVMGQKGTSDPEALAVMRELLALMKRQADKAPEFNLYMDSRQIYARAEQRRREHRFAMGHTG